MCDSVCVCVRCTYLLITKTHLPSRIAANIHATEKHAMLPLQTGGAASAIAGCRIANADADANAAAAAVAATWLRWHVPI